MNDFRIDREHVPPHDELDQMLRQWHEENAETARAGRDRLLRALARRESAQTTSPPSAHPIHRTGPATHPRPARSFVWLRAIFLSTYARAAAALVLVAFLAVLTLPRSVRPASAQVIQVAEGGKLEALDEAGNLLGPCPLRQTSVHVEIAGLFSRVTVRQHYENPYDTKIEAVYTFPLSHRAAVDRMRMIIDEDRIVEGEVREREEARRIYEQAKAANHVAALLEQERPNIFTQSVANIEPHAAIEIEISYLETVESKDGVFTFAFPMTVAPRYIPGSSTVSPALTPAELELRGGVIQLGPAQIEVLTPPPFEGGGREGGDDRLQIVGGGQIEALLSAARAINQPGPSWWGVDEDTGRMNVPPVLAQFKATYCGGTAEVGVLLSDGTGHLGGRWFFTDPDLAEKHGTGFEQNTNQVPDASRITPMPTRPPTRAGHDISLTVSIDTGGPAITSIESELHEINVIRDAVLRDAAPRFRDAAPALRDAAPALRDAAPEASAPADDEDADHEHTDFGPSLTLTLTNQREIPNRDFVLHWKQQDDQIEEATFIHTDERGGFFTLLLQPPARVDPDLIRTRELIFVLDTSGSMKGQPIEKAKSVLTRAIDRMRAGDTFNIITFAGTTDILWNQPRPNTEKNRAEALRWVNAQQGSGGTEMMQAIDAALRGGPVSRADAIPEAPLHAAELANLPADGRDVVVQVRGERFTLLAAPSDFVNTGDGITYDDDGVISIKGPFEFSSLADDAEWRLTGRWITENGSRWLDIQSVELVESPAGSRASPELSASPAGSRASHDPMRIVMFLTDGEVGNDEAIIAAVKKYADTTRVFSFGIGNSVNRYLLANMAHAARGEVEFVTQQSDPDLAVARFVTRIDAPVLTDITLEFSEGLAVSDLMPVNPAGLIPDLYDVRPLIIHGRFDPEQAQTGTLTIRGRTGAGAYERAINLDLRNRAKHDQLPTLWARAKVDQLMNADLTRVQLGNPPPEMRDQIVALGVEYQIMSRYTSFVAVEKSRVTIDGRPMLVAVPIELPSDADWSGFFGPAGEVNDDVIELTLRDLSLGLSAALVPADVVTHPGDDQTVRTYDLHYKDVSVVRNTLEALAGTERLSDLFEFRTESATNRLIAIAKESASFVILDEIVALLDQPGQVREPGLVELSHAGAQKQEYIHQALRVVRELQIQRRYPEALKVIDQILFLDDINPAAWALRDAIQTAALWQSYIANADERERELRYSHQFEENRRGANAPMPNFGPGPKSTTGVSGYPEDWPSLSLRSVSLNPQALNISSAAREDTEIKLFALSHANAEELARELNIAFQKPGLRTEFGGESDNADGLLKVEALPGTNQLVVTGPPHLTEQVMKMVNMVDSPAAGAFEGVIRLPNGEMVTFAGAAGGGFGSAGKPVRRNVPILGDIPVMGELFVASDGATREGLNFGTAAGSDDSVFDEPAMFSFAASIPFGGPTRGERDAGSKDQSNLITFPWQLDRTLKDTDGDGLTDSLWFLAPEVEAASPPAEQDAARDPIAILRGRIERIARAPEDQLRAPRLFYLFEPRGGFYRERVAMIISGLAGDGQFEIARRIAEWLVELDPSFTIATEMQTIFHDEALAEERRTAQIAELAARARRTIEDAVREAVTLQALAARVHPDLLVLLDTDDKDNAVPVAVTILVERADDAMLARLREHGLRVRGSSPTAGLVVGETARDDLRRMALLPGVRRINPADLKPAD